MKCVVGNAQLGTWCRAIHSLTQLGDEDLHFDFNDDILTVSTANSSETSFTTFLFFKPFFSNYRMASSEPEKVSIPAKIILKPYRTQKVAKSYLSSEISFEPSEDFLTVTSEGKTRAITTYKLGASANTEFLEFDSDPYSRPNCLKADAKVLSNCLSNFSHVKGLAEINLKIQGQKVTLRNCVSDITRKDGSVVTEFYLTSYDFIDYEVPNDFSIDCSFGFREFKIFTTFAEQLKLPVSIHFQEQEEPIIIVVKTDMFEARLCLSTRVKDPFSSTPHTGQPQSLNSNRISNVTSQNLSTSSLSRSVSQEMNRQQGRNGGSDVITNDISNPQQPPAKRPRITEAPPPVVVTMDSDSPPASPTPPPNPDVVMIGPLVEQMEKRKLSKAYKTLYRVMAGPGLTEEEYLSKLPGHDEVLCPDSDEEV